MLTLLKRNYLETPVRFISPRVSVSKRGNVAPEITINNEGKQLILSQVQSKPLAEALLDVALALENVLGIHQGIHGLNLTLDQYRPLAETLLNTSSSIDAILGEIL
jgi:hypothetical protein